MGDTIAIYAATVATFVAIFEFVKWWKSGAKLRVRAMPGYIIANAHAIREDAYGDGDIEPDPDNRRVLVECVNIGDRDTTILNVSISIYENWWGYLRKKDIANYIIPNPALTESLPKLVSPGSSWSGGIIQNDKMDNAIKKYILICQVGHSWSKKLAKCRIKTPPAPKDVGRQDILA